VNVNTAITLATLLDSEPRGLTLAEAEGLIGQGVGLRLNNLVAQVPTMDYGMPDRGWVMYWHRTSGASVPDLNYKQVPEVTVFYRITEKGKEALEQWLDERGGKQ